MRRTADAAGGRPGRVGLLVAAALLAAGVDARAQTPQFRHLTTEDGLANEWVMSILQDSRGFMWFGTNTGLNRYDGYHMEVFRWGPGLPGSIADDRVYVVYEDRAGTIWVGTRSSLSRFDRGRNGFTNFMSDDTVPPVAQRRVYSLLEDSRGTFWVGTTAGLYTFDRRAGRETPVALAGARTTGAVRALWEDGQGHLYVGTDSAGLFRYDLATRAVYSFSRDPRRASALAGLDIRAVVGDSGGRLWLGTYNGGLVLLDPRTGRVRQYRHDPADTTSLAIDPIRKLVADGAGGLWVGTENGGLDHFDPRAGVFQHNRTDPRNPSSLNNNSVWALFRDALGTLWVGTFSGGVNMLRPSSSWLRHYATVADNPATLGGNSVLAFAEDAQGAIWVATDGGGLNRFDPRSGSFRRYTTRTSNLSRDAVLGVAVDAQGAVWMGTWLGGLNRFDPRTGRFTSYTTANSRIPDDNIFAVQADREGRLWVGTWSEGLLRFEPATGTFTSYPIGQPGHQSQIWLIRQLRDGRLLVATLDDGLIVFDPRTGSMQRFGAASRHRPGLLSYEVRAVLENDDGTIWVGTAGGLDRLSLGSRQVEHYTAAAGLPAVPISGLARDAAGYLWISTDRGLYRYDPRSHMRWDYGAADGLGRDFNPRSYLGASDGTIYFGGNSGIDAVRPALLPSTSPRPRIAFTGFQLFNREVQIGAPGSPLQQHISETKHLSLTHAQSVFTIDFAALDYRAPSKNQYRYRLEGFDRDWTYVGPAHSATYTNLPAGDYVFRVKGSNSDGVWNEEGAALRITVLQAWWKTWWFLALVSVAVAAAILLVLWNERRRHSYLQRNVVEILGAMQRFSGGDYSVALPVQSDDAIGKLRQGFNAAVADRKRADEELRQSQKMEAVGRLAGGVAHDFNNLLTAIKGNVQLALSNPALQDTLREELQEVQRAAERAGALTRQLLAFSRKQILQPHVLSLNEVVTDMGRLLRRTVGEDIELRITLEPALATVKADPGQIEQVLVNLAVNARDAMPRGGVLSIETSNVDAAGLQDRPEAEPVNYVALRVRDTGNGMDPETLEHIFEPFFTTKEQGKGTGLGLSTVYGIVKQSGGFVEVDSDPGRGTAFTVYLPQADGAPATHDDAASATVPAGSATVLLVEDEDAVRRLASRILQRNGYRVLTAASGEAAVELVEREEREIDLLLTDVVMPGMSGRELAERLLPTHPTMRLLYTSGYTEDAIVRHGVTGLGTVFLEKPFTPEELLHKVQEALETRRTALSYDEYPG